MNFHAVTEFAKAVLPRSWQDRARLARDWLLRRGAFDFRVKRERVSGTDYTTAYDHKSMKRAKASILWAGDWDETTSVHLEVFRAMNMVQNGQRVIDYGMGIGRISKVLLENYRVDVIGVDRSQEMLRKARRYIPRHFFDENRITLWSDEELLRRIDSLSGTVDVLLFMLVLQHIPEPILDDLLPRLLRCLTPQGHLFVFGNAVLDVDATGSLTSKPIQTFLEKHVEILDSRKWTSITVDGRARVIDPPRYSFVAKPRRGVETKR